MWTVEERNVRINSIIWVVCGHKVLIGWKIHIQTTVTKENKHRFKENWQAGFILHLHTYTPCMCLCDIFVSQPSITTRQTCLSWFLSSELTVFTDGFNSQTDFRTEDECLWGGRGGQSRTSRVQLSVCEQWPDQRRYSELQWWTWTLRHKVRELTLTHVYDWFSVSSNRGKFTFCLYITFTYKFYK